MDDSAFLFQKDSVCVSQAHPFLPFCSHCSQVSPSFIVSCLVYTLVSWSLVFL